MNNFDINRFKSYGLYDLTINKKYYRSQAMITIFTLMGIALTCFLFRWMICDLGGDEVPFFDYRETSATVAILAGAISIINIVLAGCTFHNLLTKQGRISELTLPATSLEKFTWHVCLNVFGGILLCMVGLLCADALNAVLMAMTFPLDGQHSLFLQCMDGMTMDSLRRTLIQMHGEESLAVKMMAGGFLLMITNTVCQLCAFVYGNSIKYRNNIIWTYAVIQVITIVVITFTIEFIWQLIVSFKHDFTFTSYDLESFVHFMVYGASVFFTGLSALLLWRAYVRYSKAVITSKRNK